MGAIISTDSIIDGVIKDDLGRTALHRAAIDSNIPQIKRLLSAKINFDMRYTNPSSLNDAMRTVQRLPDLNVRDNHGRTPFYYMVQKAKAGVVESFLNFGVNVRVVDCEGCNLLFPAVKYNEDVEVLQLLIDQGLNVNHRCKSGSTPLHQVCWELESVKKIKCLLRNGANVNATDLDGSTPLFEAVRHFCWVKGFRGVIEKNLNFVVEHTDFNLDYDVNFFHILYFLLNSDADWQVKILKHVAKLVVLGVPVNEILLKTLTRRRKYNDYFIMCKDELFLAKDTKFTRSWITYYNLLVDNRKKLKNYAGNKNLMKEFQISDCEKNFPIYGMTMIENVDKGIWRRKLFDKSSIALSGCLPIFNPNHLIIRGILDCILSKKDLFQLCK